MNTHKFFISLTGIFLFCITLTGMPPAKVKKDIRTLSARADTVLSPYTGYTRAHWLELTEKIIAGALPHLDKQTGLPDLTAFGENEAFLKRMIEKPLIARRQAFERIMMAVVIYTTATGKDRISGYNGSISAPFLTAITQGTDPDSPSYWGISEPYDQVGCVFALGIYLNPTLFWDKLNDRQKENLLTYFTHHTHNQAYDNNHHYFHMLPSPLLMKYGKDSNRAHLDSMYNRLMGWYRGDGWFIDGSNRGFDYYNHWGFHFKNLTLYRFDENWKQAHGAEIEKSVRQFLLNLPYLYGRDGGPVPWGRSLTYRFASNAALAWAAYDGINPLSPGLSRRIASGSMKYFWDHKCLGENGLLNLGFRGDNASVAEDYSAPGSPYWATHGLAFLLIPETDPFWTAREEPMPADLKGGRLILEGPQLLVKVSQTDGESKLFPVGQPFQFARNKWQTGIKYDQHSYSSSLGWCVLAEGGPDIGANRSGYSFDGKRWRYREHARAIRVETDYLVSHYYLNDSDEPGKLNSINNYEIVTHALVGEEGEVHIFWHNNPEPIYLFLGGYGIQIPGNETLKADRQSGLILSGTTYQSGLSPVRTSEGETDYMLLEPLEGWADSHLWGGKGAYPYWKSSAKVKPNIPQVFYVNGTKDRPVRLPDIRAIIDQSILTIRFEGKEFKIKIP